MKTIQSVLILISLFGFIQPIYAAEQQKTTTVPIQTPSSQNPTSTTASNPNTAAWNGYFDPNDPAQKEKIDAVAGYMTDWSAHMGKALMDHVKKSMDHALSREEWLMARGQSPITSGSSGFPNFSEAAMDTFETDTEYVVTFDLPGVPKENTSVEIRDGRLFVSGSRETQTEQKTSQEGDEQVQVSQQSQRKFERSITLPTSIDPTKVKAEQKNGVLTVRFEKLKSEKPDVVKVTIQ